MSRDDLELLTEAIAHLQAITQHLARGDMDDDIIADAVSLRLAAAIDAAGRVAPARRSAIFGDEWPLAWATRNRIVHGYAFVNRHIVESTVQRDLPSIESAIRREAAELSSAEPDDGPHPSVDETLSKRGSGFEVDNDAIEGD